MARSLRTIAGLLANPRRRRKARKARRNPARFSFFKGRSHRKGRKARRNPRKLRTTSGRFKKARRNPKRRARRNPAYVLGPPQRSRRNPSRRRARRNPAFSFSPKSALKSSLALVPALAVSGGAPIAAIKAQAWLATKPWADMFSQQPHLVRFGILALIGAAATRMITKKVRALAPYSAQATVAAAAGIFGAGVGMQQAVATPAGALVLSGVGPTGALAFGQRPLSGGAYQVGADTGAVVLGAY